MCVHMITKTDSFFFYMVSFCLEFPCSFLIFRVRQWELQLIFVWKVPLPICCCLFSFEFRKFVFFDKNQHFSSVKLSKFFHSNTIVNNNGTCFLCCQKFLGCPWETNGFSFVLNLFDMGEVSYILKFFYKCQVL